MALQVDPIALRMGAQHFSAASNAMEASLNSMYGRVLALVEDGQSGWIGDGATAFLARLNAEVDHYRNGIQALRQIPPILLYLAVEMEEIIALRRQADELEAEAQNASPIEAAWLLARAAALRTEAEAKAEFADFKGAAEFLAIDVRQMATDFWDSAPLTFIRDEITEGVTWMKQEFRAAQSDLLSIGESIWQDPRSFVAGLLTSVGKEISFGTLPLGEPDDPDAAYYAGRTLGDITGVVGGTIMTGAGGALEGGGAVLDITIAGAAIGVPADAVGSALIAGGLSIEASSWANYSDDTTRMFAKVQEGTDSGTGGNEATKSAAEGTVEAETISSALSKSGYDSAQIKQVEEAFGQGAEVVTLKQDLRVYRYYGGGAGARGRWVTTSLLKDPVNELALPPGSTAIKVVEWIIPKGTQVIKGTVAPNFGRPGGALQIFLPDSSVLQGR